MMTKTELIELYGIYKEKLQQERNKSLEYKGYVSEDVEISDILRLLEKIIGEVPESSISNTNDKQQSGGQI
jgi:hypothetical protein